MNIGAPGEKDQDSSATANKTYDIIDRMESTRSPRPKALLVGIQLPKVSTEEMNSSLEELRRLCDTLGYECVGFMSQRRASTSGAIVLGEGKLQELASWTGGTGKIASMVQVKKSKAAERFAAEKEAKELGEGEIDDFEDESDEDLEFSDEPESELDKSDGALQGPPEGVRADVVVFDCELSPSQLRNLESASGVQVLDRTGVIIEIFSRHARTRAARLQVEIARLKYLAPRLRETGGGGDRQGGGVGGKGAGETSLELDRRKIRDRIKELKDDLAFVQDESTLRRTRRSQENCVALIGYTNAGKSSLMRAITGSEILVADKLFATLETTVRPLDPPSFPKVLISDTVGFIKKLPHDLVASFRSTLDEALNADLLLYVVDASDLTFRSQHEVTRQVIAEIGATESPSWLVLNKRDRLSHEQVELLRAEFPEAILLSTRDKSDLALLREKLLGYFEGDMVDESLTIPYTLQGAVGEVRRLMRVLDESYNENGLVVRVRVAPDTLARFKQRFSL